MKVVLLLLAIFSLPLAAELPTTAYLKMQQTAPEALEIRVDKAKRGYWISPGEVVTATVMKVHKTTSAIKVGDVIKIRYRHVKLRGRVGPSPIPRLTKKKTYPAFLKKTEKDHFEPTARGMSFQKIEPKR
ncbi:hypothetical protein N9Y81_00040 [Akkermansiaceae bacterium]|jgi:hypothetical protein|nr:hypothetical protein [Akkermansiaceae bacterium]